MLRVTDGKMIVFAGFFFLVFFFEGNCETWAQAERNDVEKGLSRKQGP